MRSGRWSKTMDYGEGSAENAQWPAQPAWFQSNADFPNLISGLRDVGFDEAEVAKIMGGNWLRFCEAAWL
jgi:microsomal dipeptidase-like Zn-dependent dipeptidase